MQTVTKTGGADPKVLTKYLALGAGNGQAVLVAKPGVAYRVVGVQASLDANGSFKMYHTAAATADNVIAANQLLSGVPYVAFPGDWADQVGLKGGVVTINVVGAGIVLLIHYVELG